MFPTLFTEDKICIKCKFYSETLEGTPRCYRYPNETLLSHDSISFKIEPESFCGEFKSRKINNNEIN